MQSRNVGEKERKSALMFWVIMGVASLMIGIARLGFGLFMLTDKEMSRGTVVSSRVYMESIGRSSHLKNDIVVAYMADNVAYQHEENISNIFVKGKDTIPIYYLPGHPEMAYIFDVAGAVGWLVLGAFVLLIAVWFWAKYCKSKKDYT